MRATRSSVNSPTSDRPAGFPTVPAAVVSEARPDWNVRVEAREYWILTALLSLVAIVALSFFHSRNEILLSGVAVAHISIARCVFDSRTPGPLQLGSVWLPLPHLLTIPFIVSKAMWQSGIGGSVISVVSDVIRSDGFFLFLYPLVLVGTSIATACVAAETLL